MCRTLVELYRLGQGCFSPPWKEEPTTTTTTTTTTTVVVEAVALTAEAEAEAATPLQFSQVDAATSDAEKGLLLPPAVVDITAKERTRVNGGVDPSDWGWFADENGNDSNYSKEDSKDKTNITAETKNKTI